MEKMKVALLNPMVPHYREEFFKLLSSYVDLDIYTYQNQYSKKNFKISDLSVKSLKSLLFFKKRFLLFSITPFLFKRYHTIILMLHFGHISTWLLLLLKVFHRKKIILWGQGISVKRYMEEERKPNLLLKQMIRMADGVWLYTEKERDQWKAIFPNKKIVALNNTISGVGEILGAKNSHLDRQKLKEKYKIVHQTCFIFCARFDNPHRRVDLLVNSIKDLDSSVYGFIIIGEGQFKPDFSSYPNVYDFGSVYDKQIKDELFEVADIYYQPGWVGLSVVEAMAYGKPILTYKRSEEVLQCVEYDYIKDHVNGILLADSDDFKERVPLLSDSEISAMGRNSKEFVRRKLTMKSMVENALSIMAI
ncbi:glycosyltransferase family 4 protein [Olivibacter sp. SDN3]|uniref:glycosyltransferase n=1 Tax=Olivibacter sp. SDN3 TaxID=2764720 RepID=UPI0016514001|nr:glycosyltransferase [Olivibacter sp. SDN3]QNL51632.1 glycosyltransferase family 4 protein [Olivibacter sp. SDN3]